ncbi:divalent-cation tolerance protein CutA [Parasphingorhabdus sp.]|uniref:divalent-cation tolerance protein CutA n=1 Tax=Parasphingorhabdus sp. TaxID=2709688 RepID=UPI003A8CE37A
MTGSVALIYSTFGSAEEARRVALSLLQEKLVACANHFAPVVSQYEFQGKLHEEQEFPALLKTSTEMVGPAMSRLSILHSFDTPAILHWVVDAADPDYEKWLLGQVRN